MGEGSDKKKRYATVGGQGEKSKPEAGRIERRADSIRVVAL